MDAIPPNGPVGIPALVCEADPAKAPWAGADMQKKAIEVAANASLSKSISYRIYENGKALKDLTENHGVQLHDTPADYFPAYMNAANALLKKASDENEFFAEVWQSQKDFAAIAVPFWAGAQASNASLGKAFADSIK